MVFLYQNNKLEAEREKNRQLREKHIETKFDSLLKEIERAKLTEEEKKILIKINEGLSYKEIANDLCKSIETVKKQMNSLHNKLDVDKGIELVKYAIALVEKMKTEKPEEKE